MVVLNLGARLRSGERDGLVMHYCHVSVVQFKTLHGVVV